MIFGEYGIEESAIEVAVWRPEFGVVRHRIADDIVRRLEPQPGCLLIEQTAVDQRLEDIVDDPELFCLLNIDRGAKPRAEPLELAAHGRLQFFGVDALVADRGDRRIGRAVAEDVADPPDPEDHDQETEQTLDDDGPGPRANSLEHGGKWPLLGCGRGRLTRPRAGVMLDQR